MPTTVRIATGISTREKNWRRSSATFAADSNRAKLKQLDGKKLFERMHGRGDNDSLAYWLEFKYDAEEFPGTECGGIGGGGAFKFGIFYRRDAGMWLAGGPTPKGHEISVAEAIAVASKQRDQFLRGCELLEQRPLALTMRPTIGPCACLIPTT